MVSLEYRDSASEWKTLVCIRRRTRYSGGTPGGFCKNWLKSCPWNRGRAFWTWAAAPGTWLLKSCYHFCPKVGLKLNNLVLFLCLKMWKKWLGWMCLNGWCLTPRRFTIIQGCRFCRWISKRISRIITMGRIVWRFWLMAWIWRTMRRIAIFR